MVGKMQPDTKQTPEEPRKCRTLTWDRPLWGVGGGMLGFQRVGGRFCLTLRI